MVITALPAFRRNNYNIFYSAHVVLAVLVMIMVCLHASTGFYFLLPGLLLWIGDWFWRITHSLSTVVEATVESVGNDWYRITLPPNYLISTNLFITEKGHGVRLPIPAATYHLNFLDVSKVQIHPFTAVDVGNLTVGPCFLYRKSPERKILKKRDRE